MEQIVLFCMSIWTNPLYLGITVYVLLVLIQLMISAFVIKKRRDTLEDEYGFNDKRLRRMWFMSGLLFPVTMYYGIKAGISKLIRSRKYRKFDIEEDDGEDVDDEEY